VSELQEFVKNRLSSELQELKNKGIGQANSQLNDFEKTLIYYYSLEGYQSINENLREGLISDYESHLNDALAKLPNHEGLVYRGIELSKTQIDYYIDSFESKSTINELAFISCSTSLLIAHNYGNTTMTIVSKTGKMIENLSFYGLNSGQNEKEVLFQSKTTFKVLDVEQENDYINLILEEI